MKTDSFGIPLNENVVNELKDYISKLRSEFGEKAMKSIPDVKEIRTQDSLDLVDALVDVDNAIMRASDLLTKLELEG